MLVTYMPLRRLSIALLAMAIPVVALAQSSYPPPAGYGTPYTQQAVGQPVYPAGAPGQPYPTAPGAPAAGQPQAMPAQLHPQWNAGQAAGGPPAPAGGMNSGGTPYNPAGQAPYGYPAGMQQPPAGSPSMGGAAQSEWTPSTPGQAPQSAGPPYGVPAYGDQQSGAGAYPQSQMQQDPYAASQQPGYGQQPFAGQQPGGYPQQNAPPQRVNPYNIPPQQGQSLEPAQDPQYRLAATPTPTDPSAAAAQPSSTQHASQSAQPGEHPLMPALRWAREGLPYVQAIEDYSCIVHKRERVDGHLGDHQAMFCKVRHRPFSVYLYFLGPPNLKGQEVIYVEGKNNGNLQAHSTGVKGIVGTVSLDPRGHLAMRGNRYPVTELGVQNLIQRLIEVGEHDANYGECDVQFLKAKISNRPCTCIQVHHPVPRRNFRFHLARIYVDDELNIPIRFESWDWPARQGGEPLLLEEYTYQNLKLNNGFTDQDFDVSNPKYGFR